MRYQIFSLQHSVLVDLGLNLEDALLLDWILHWKDGTGMKREYIEEVADIGYWINYETVVQELPIIFKQPTEDMDEKALSRLLRNNKDKVARMLKGNLSKVLKTHKMVYKGKGARLGSMVFVTLNRECIDRLKNISYGTDINTNKKSLTCSEVKDLQKSRIINVNDSIPQSNGKENTKTDFVEIAYDRCLKEIDGFEYMESHRKDFYVNTMLRKIAVGE